MTTQNKLTMKYSILLLFFLFSCKPDRKTEADISIDVDTARVKQADSKPESIVPEKTYSNARFQAVSVTKTAENQYQISGKAQIFEASFSWVIEDGHNELKKGHEMTDAGAPEWGNFSFTVDAEKERPNSTLTLILFESSAEDGSRQHELPILLQ